MAEFSSLVAVFIDPDTGAPSSLQALVDGDTVASSVFDPATRRTLETVVDSSSSWEAGLDADTYNNLVITSGRAEDMVTFSASVQVSAANLDTSTRDVIASSTDISAYIESNEGGWNAGIDAGTLNDLISVSGSTVSLSGSVGDTSSIFNDRPNIIITSGRAEDMVTFSADVESSASILDTSVLELITDLSTNVYTNSGTWESGGGGGANPFDPDDLVSLSGSVISISGTVTDGSAIFNDRPSLISVSGTVNDGSAIFNDRPSLISISGTVSDGSAIFNDRPSLISISGSVGDTSSIFNDRPNLVSVSGTVKDTSSIFNDRPNLVSVSGSVLNTSSFFNDRSNLVSVSATVNDGSAIFNDRPSLISISGTVNDTSSIFNDRPNIIITSGRAEDMVTFSANVETSTAVLDTSVTKLITDLSTNVYTNSGTWESGGGGGGPDPFDYKDLESVSGSVISISGTVNDGSAIFEDRPSLISISGTTTAVSSSVFTASANWDTAYGDRDNNISVSGSMFDGSANWTTIYNDRPNITSVSGSVLDSSANWDTAYGDRGNNISVSGSMFDGSANWTTIYNDRPNITSVSGAVLDSSANWDTAYGDRGNNISVSGTTFDGSANWTTIYNDRPNIISVSGSTLDGSANWTTIYNDRPNIISVSGSTLDGSANWTTIYNDRPNIISVSGSVDASNTAFLNGTTPTLSNNLDADGNSLNNVPIIYGNNNLTLQSKNSSQRGNIVFNDNLDIEDNSISGINSLRFIDSNDVDPSGAFVIRRFNNATTQFSGVIINELGSAQINLKAGDGTASQGIMELSSTNRVSLIHGDGATVGVQIGTNTSRFVTADFKASADNWNSVFDTTYSTADGSSTWTGGGGGTTIEEPHVQGGIVFASGTGGTAGYGNTAAGTGGQYLQSNGTGTPFFSVIRTNQLKNPLGSSPAVGSLILGNGTSYYEDSTIANTSGTWDSAYGDRANNISVSGSVLDNSANWDTAYGDRTNNISVSTTVLDNSANWQSAYSSDLFPSATGFANWNTAYGDRDNNISVSTTLGGVSANIATNTGNISTNTGNISTNTGNIATNTANISVLGGVSGNIATNTGNISTNTGNISTNTGNISTNTGNISVLGGVSGNIATNTGNISTNTGNISTNTANISTNTGNISVLGGVSGNIATNTANISTNTGNISTNTGNISVLGGVSGNIATNTGNISTNTGNISTNTGNISTNTGNITALGSASGNWNTIYGDRDNIISVSSTVLNNSGTWGGGGGGASAEGFQNWNNTYDSVLNTSANWNTAYTSATNTTDVSSIFSGNINVIGTTPSHSGTIGTTNAGTYGLETTGNCSIIAPSIILSATSAYQFRKNGSTTFTDTDFPQSCRDWDSTYGTVLANSGTWGGGGGGGVAAGITVVNTGTDNINTAGALVPLDVTAGYPAYGSYATDFSYTPGNAYVTINTAGTYEVTFNVGYTTTTVRWNGILKIYKGTGGAAPSSWIGYGAGKMGYVRNSSGHSESSLIVTCLVTCAANDTVGGWVAREAANGTCSLVANETFMTIKRMA